MATVPPPIPRSQVAELSLTDEGKEELAALQAERAAILDMEWPEPTLGDVLDARQRWQDDSALWRQYVLDVRRNRYAQDTTPPKWREKLNIPDDRRFRTNLTANEILRVSAVMGRNPPKVTLRPDGSTDKAIQRAEKQASWGQSLVTALERNNPPLWAKGDDAASENGQGYFELYMTDAWKAAEKLIDERDPEVDDRDLDKKIDEALKGAGLPFALRYVDSLSGYIERDDHGTAYAMVVERKHYKRVYERLRKRLSADAFAKAQLPPVSSRAWPADAFVTRYGYMGSEEVYDGRPDDRGEVEVIRYYDRRWLVEVVAGKLVEVKEHHWPGVPVFRQLGKVTSNASTEWQMQGVVNAAMLTQELALNDLFTLALDNLYTYGRPFPVITTEINGQPLYEADGSPTIIKLDDPSRPPQLGPGQAIVDAFGQFRGHIEPALLQQIQAFWQMSGLNPIAQGESPGSDPSGYAINTLQSGAQALYESMLDNKCRTLEEIITFCRLAVRDTIQETVYLTVETQDGDGIEHLGLSPDDVDEVPAEVSIDPMSDTQRMAFTEWLANGNNGGYIARRTVQRHGYGGVISDPDDEDRQILRDDVRRGLVPLMVKLILDTLAQDAFAAPTPAPPGGAPPPPGGAPGMDMQGLRNMGALPADGATVGTARQSPMQAVQPSNGRPGMPAQQGGVPLVG